MNRCLCALFAVLMVGCAAQTPSVPLPDRPPHHRIGGFQNNYLEFAPKGVATLLQWKWHQVRDGLPRPPSTPIPVVAPDLPFITANARAGAAMQPAVTWIGHATVLAQLGGINVLTDPIFSERASPLKFAGPKRAQPPGVPLNQLPRIDAVVISHNHYDHLDLDSVVALNAQAGGPPVFLVPLGNKAWFESAGITNVREMDWWQSHRIGAVEIVMTPVQHWSGRTLTDRLETLWGGWAVLAPDCHLFFSGDTGYSADFGDVRKRLAPVQNGDGFDIALLAVGGYEPRWFMKDQHVNPDEAVRMHRDLGAKRSLGIHWGTFELTDESLDEPPRALAVARRDQGVSDEAFFVVAIGETRKIPRRGMKTASPQYP